MRRPGDIYNYYHLAKLDLFPQKVTMVYRILSQCMKMEFQFVFRKIQGNFEKKKFSIHIIILRFSSYCLKIYQLDYNLLSF
ncbi:hypothetical protein NQ318_012240 [Aromia moschata]|uniref:Uncharacterized protein n=1 Tax=Aromia moschata TaxID=1265417 RepID=A0AAV8YJ11_9CUCU|nr:hypothetical protein NQ318_012240 [Aromia moschata]